MSIGLMQADRLIVPIPAFFDEKMWEHHDGDRHFLTEAGFAELRAAIRAENEGSG
jgi:hypothetical protein